MDHSKLKISKIEAAQRQLDCAISLWFLENDECSIHTLAAAAHQIVHDINEKQPTPHELMYNSAIIVDQHRREFVAHIKKPMNFLKHADNDPTGVIEFAPSLSVSYMLFSIVGLKNLGHPPSDHAHALLQWISFHEPHWMNASYREALSEKLNVEDLAQIRQVPKAAFYDIVLRGRSGALGPGRITVQVPIAE